MSIPNDRQHLVFAETPEGREAFGRESSSSDTESSSPRRRYRTRQFIREQDREQGTAKKPFNYDEYMEACNRRLDKDVEYGTAKMRNEFHYILGSKLRHDVKEINGKLHERRIERLRQIYNEDKKLDWMFDTPDV